MARPSVASVPDSSPTAPSAPSAPSPAPLLAPGLRVVTRGRDHLQVGLHPGRRVVLPRTPAVERVLAALLERQPPGDDPASGSVLERLRRARCLDDRRPGTPGPVAVLGGWPRAGPAVAELLAGSGVPLTRWPSRAAVVLVLAEGELDRDLLDPLLRRRTPHLVVRLVDGAALLGPFVQPGATACLRCLDAHGSVTDPDLVAVTTRYLRATQRPRADGEPDVADPVLPVLALTWAVRDVLTHLGGRTPSTWSRTVHVGADGALPEVETWSPHPECGCCWAADARSSGTMGS